MPDAASNLFTRLSTATTSTATISSGTSIARNTSLIKITATAPEFYSTHSMQTTLSSQPTQDPSRTISPPVCPVAWGRYFLPGTTCPIPQVVSAPEIGDQLSRGTVCILWATLLPPTLTRCLVLGAAHHRR